MALGKRVAKVSGQEIRGEGFDYLSGEWRRIAVDSSGQVHIVLTAVDIANVHVMSGYIAVLSGEVHVMSGVVGIVQSGALAVHVTSGVVGVVQSGAFGVQVSGGVHIESGVVGILQSGALAVKISGAVEIAPPTAILTGLIRPIKGSGGEVLHSGAVKAVQVKAITLSGVIVIGSSGALPWYEATCSGLGFVLENGEVKSFDIDNLDKVYVAAQTSGDQISWMGVN